MFAFVWDVDGLMWVFMYVCVILYKCTKLYRDLHLNIPFCMFKSAKSLGFSAMYIRICVCVCVCARERAIVYVPSYMNIFI